MEDRPLHPGLLARRRPCPTKVLHARSVVAEEQGAHHAAGLLLDVPTSGKLALEHLAQLGSDREHSPLEVLRLAGVRPEPARLKVNGATQSTQTGDLDLANTFTIELWVKPDNAARVDPRQDFVSKWGTGTEASFALWLRDRTVRLSTRQEPTNTVTYGVKQLADGIWQHVAVTFDNGTVRIYVDGELDVETTGNLAPQNSATPLSLGRQDAPSFTCCYYDGVMDEVRIWSVARTQRDIQKNMEKKINTQQLPADLLAYWRMDEGAGDNAFDLTLNGFDMRLGNAVGSDAADPVWVSPGMP
jgi:hypothetical protein